MVALRGGLGEASCLPYLGFGPPIGLNKNHNIETLKKYNIFAHALKKYVKFYVKWRKM